MRMTWPVFFCLCLLSTAARAASPEDDYLAARDRSIAKLKGMEKAKASVEKLDAEQAKDLADLESRLRAVVGEVSIKSFPATGKINLQTLTASDIGFGVLDGLSYAEPTEDAPQLLVTTRGLMDKWLAASAKEKEESVRLPADLEAALKLDNFYSFALGRDAAFTRSETLEVAPPEGATLTRALLGGWSQDIAPNPAEQIVVTLVKGGKVYIATFRPKTEVAEIAACQAIWTAAQKKSEKLQAVYAKSGRKDEKAFEDSTKAEEKGLADFNACFRERAKKEAFYPALVKEAQGMVDRIGGK